MKDDRETQETEDRILAAAHRVFVRRGMSGARMQEIADEAGVNKALLHYYFRSKDRLAQTVFKRVIGALLPRAYAIMGSEKGLEVKVRELIAAEIEFLREHPYLPGYVVSELNFHPDLVLRTFGERGPPPLGTLRAQLSAEAEAGAIRPIEPEQFMANLMSLIFFPFAARPLLGFMLGMAEGDFDGFMERRKGELADFFLAGLRP